jgi:ABC-type branched-subunit amino acid transport system permease subunit/ABC-type branched-subunit amino acid transport system ATPase component
VKWVLFAFCVALAAAVPVFVGNQYYIQILVNIGINVILVLGLTVITGMAGQLSLCQGAFFGIGAYASALLVMTAGLSFWLSLPLAGAITASAGFVLGVPALRLRGHYLAMITLAFAVIVHQVIQNWSELTRGSSGLVDIPWPDPISVGGLRLSLESRQSYYVFVVIAVALAMMALRILQRSRLGRSLYAIREDEVAAELMGIDTRLCKLLAFAISAFFAGVGGALYAHYAKILTPDLFGVMQSIDILVMAVIGGAASIVGALLGASVVTALPEMLRAVSEYRLLIFGAILIGCVLFVPGGLISLLRRPWRSSRSKPTAKAPVPVASERAAPKLASLAGVAVGAVVLEVDQVAKRFGGLTAVRNVSWRARAGEITALIGPNGSGKTTMINLVSGVYTLTAGGVRLEGRLISGLRPSAISQAGVSRTFQKLRLFRNLPVGENVAVAMASASVPRFGQRLWKGRVLGYDANADAAVMDLLRIVGLDHRANDLAKNLSHGEQRLLEIARALATRPRVLLLDEPAAGLSGVDVQLLEKVLFAIRRTGVAIVLVEHHMDLVMQISDRIVVLNHGEKIFDGNPASARHDPGVIAAYLGDQLEEAAVA